ncbi:GNAT family N-acetyltransferase [Legionella oakridgensis]|uniref:GNAT family acetyltransferase n=2 Tax=Legionella oakridgensis TaxID=29423 RepID=A0A0W0WYC1_9GAMM|nr:GNAT family N-acetyltransferase [Legionella oakridgensis]ETO94424.1 putative acetyltransferase [Legionella oakridgensis RV-2-2007]KTD37317.1 GNAT family acetyltransferase [Legionella oakridgensis]STY15771.1 GNAT family acetyltransferase [Legionella longbeachae]
MNIQKLSKAHIGILNDYLDNHVETCMFIRSNLYHSGIEYQNTPYHGEYWASFDDANNINGVLVHYWNGNLMMQAENNNILYALINRYKTNQIKPIAGILGDDSQAGFVIQSLDIKPSQFAINYTEDLFSLSLNHLNVPEKAKENSFQLRSIEQCDISILKRWFIDYKIEALGATSSPELEIEVLDEINDESVNKNRWVLYYKNNPVSLCGFNAHMQDIVQIGPVYTPPELRNKGYAKVIVALCLNRAKMNQVDNAILFTNNPPATHVYRSLGFQVIGQFRLAILKKPVSL